MNKTKLKLISDTMKRALDDSECAGVSVMVIHDGDEVFYDNAGFANIETGKKMSRDTIFRIFSQTKPFTGVASTICLERGL